MPGIGNWAMALAIAAACATTSVQAYVTDRPHGATPVGLSASVNRAIAERAAVLLERNYTDPTLGARYAATLRKAAARGDYAEIRDRQALATRLTGDLQAVAPDGHLHFYLTEPTAPPPPPPGPNGLPAMDGDRPIVPGIRALKWIEPGVAYLSFEHFDDRPEAMDTIRRFLRDYGSARALIIDSRENFGGAFDMIGLLSNHFFATSRHLADMDMSRHVVEDHGSPFPVDGKSIRRTDGPPGLVRFEHWSVPATDDTRWFDKPIYYLTSHQTFSAAEHLAMVLKSTRRATLIGEATGGGNHFGGTEPVGGGLELFVPIGRTTDPATGRDWEKVGIQPDVVVPASDALTEALRRARSLPPAS